MNQNEPQSLVNETPTMQDVFSAMREDEEMKAGFRKNIEERKREVRQMASGFDQFGTNY